MSGSPTSCAAYLEVGKNRIFASAVDWPGWCRSGRDEAEALESLFAYGRRYAQALRSSRLGFVAPRDPSQIEVVERLKGNATTDFGAPDIPPSADSNPADSADVQRYERLQAACWRAFDRAVAAAQGRELRRGPRGGGRDLTKIVDHVVEAQAAYLSVLGWGFKPVKTGNADDRAIQVRQEIPKALEAAARGELPRRGPRGGKRWSPRAFVRRAAWHVLDHAWEIEDRVIE